MFIFFEAVIVLIVSNMSYCDSNIRSSEAIIKEFAKRDGKYHNDENNLSHIYHRDIIHQFQERPPVQTDYIDGVAERQDSFSADEISLALSIGAAIGATVALIFHFNDMNNVNNRIKSLEDAQSSICTSVKGITNADDGKSLDGTFTDSDSAEKGWMFSIANTQTPTC